MHRQVPDGELCTLDITNMCPSRRFSVRPHYQAFSRTIGGFEAVLNLGLDEMVNRLHKNIADMMPRTGSTVSSPSQDMNLLRCNSPMDRTQFHLETIDQH